MGSGHTSFWGRCERSFLAASTAAIVLFIWAPSSSLSQQHQPVELELVLAVDVSVSVDSGEYALKTTGLALAFRDQHVITAIEAAGDNGIAVAVIHWAVGLQQKLAVDWTHVYDKASAFAFARAIEASPRSFTGNRTDITRALSYSSQLFQDNGYQGRRRVVDISGDGRNNAPGRPGAMRDWIVSSGIVINGFAILGGDLILGAYYEQNVTGGTASFVVTADSVYDFPAAIRRKLEREIAVPLAATPANTTPPT